MCARSTLDWLQSNNIACKISCTLCCADLLSNTSATYRSSGNGALVSELRDDGDVHAESS